LNLRV